jgi:hypothetical protein
MNQLVDQGAVLDSDFVDSKIAEMHKDVYGKSSQSIVHHGIVVYPSKYSSES